MPLPPGILAHSRGVVTSQYSVMPAEGILRSRLPYFERTDVRVQTSPAMGARFAQIMLTIEPGGGTTSERNDGLEHFFYGLEGEAQLAIDGDSSELVAHGFAYVPAGRGWSLRVEGDSAARLIWIKRPYEAVDGIDLPGVLRGHRDNVARDRNEGTDTEERDEGRYWQYLIGNGDLRMDMEVNILGFEPGVYFPYVETHVMEHGLYMLEGQMLYLLAGDQHEVWESDFIWMAAYCPQFCFCTGWEDAAYLLYKDVNRDIRFDWM